MLQPKGFFTALAEKIGGIVLPPLFVGPDGLHTVHDGQDYYGMDAKANPPRQLDGSAYRVEDDLFRALLHGILRQLKRAGFKVVVAHGHGPSTGMFIKNTPEWERELGLRLLHCWHHGEDEGLQTDHAGGNETSMTMLFKPGLVRMDLLPTDGYSQSMFHDDPVLATAERGAGIVARLGGIMEGLIREALA
jgi:creatinine amidohydrolase